MRVNSRAQRDATGAGPRGFVDVRDEHGHLLFRLHPELGLIEIKPHRRGVAVVDLKGFLDQRIVNRFEGWTTLLSDLQ